MDEKRVDDLRQDLQELKREMHEGFNSLERRFNLSSDELKNSTQAIETKKDEEIKEIKRLLEDNARRITEVDRRHSTRYTELYNLFTAKFNKLDRRLMNLFLAGNIIGMLIGSVVTVVVQIIIKTYL